MASVAGCGRVLECRGGGRGPGVVCVYMYVCTVMTSLPYPVLQWDFPAME